MKNFLLLSSSRAFSVYLPIEVYGKRMGNPKTKSATNPNQFLNDTINQYISAEKIYAAVFEDDSFTKVAPTDMVVGDTVHMAIVNKMETAAFVKPTKCWLSSSMDPADNTNKEVVINNGCAKNVSPNFT